MTLPTRPSEDPCFVRVKITEREIALLEDTDYWLAAEIGARLRAAYENKAENEPEALEKPLLAQVDSAMEIVVENWLYRSRDKTQRDGTMVALWLLSKRLQQNTNTNLLGRVFEGIGVGAASTLVDKLGVPTSAEKAGDE